MSPTNPTHRDEPFSGEAFLEFCRSKPAEEHYPGFDGNKCALAQFGFPGLSRYNHHKHGVPLALYECAVPLASYATAPRTFGALATRLERALAEQVSG